MRNNSGSLRSRVSRFYIALPSTWDATLMTAVYKTNKTKVSYRWH